MKHNLQIGIIGLGGMGQGLLNALYGKRPISEVKIVALADSNAEKLQVISKKFQIDACFTDHREMLNKANLDAVYIATPNCLHKQQTIDALKAGCHVLCEKPVALTGVDAAAMVKAAANAKKVFMVNFPMRFTPQSIFLKHMFQRGDFGEIYYAKAAYLRRRGVPGLGGWFTTKKLSGGGPLIDLGVHILDRAYWLLGAPEPRTVTAITFNHLINESDWGDWPPPETRIGDKFNHTVDVEDFASAMIRFKNGTCLMLEASWAGHCRDGQRFEFLGTKSGCMESAEGLRFFETRRGVPVDVTPDVKVLSAPTWPFQHFIDCILQKKAPLMTEQEIVNVIRILEAIYKSAENGAEVKL